jgi:hypothetical protein
VHFEMVEPVFMLTFDACTGILYENIYDFITLLFMYVTDFDVYALYIPSNGTIM